MSFRSDSRQRGSASQRPSRSMTSKSADSSRYSPQKRKKPATRSVAGFRSNRVDQYNRWRLVTSREERRIWRFTAAAALRLRSCVGFS